MALFRPLLAPFRTQLSVNLISPRICPACPISSFALTNLSRRHNRHTFRFASQQRPRQTPRYNRFNRAQKLYSLWYTSPGFRYGVGAAAGAGGIFYYVNLEQVPISGRRRFNVISPEYEIAMAKGQDTQVLQQYRGRVLPPSHPSSQMVNRVLERLISAAGLSLEGWEVRVIDDPEQKNAFVMPGGKVFVFTGILPICGGEDGLAAVLGHEISHTVAHHVGEKISSYFLLIPFALCLQLVFDSSGSFTQLLLDTLLTLPNSRKQEVSSRITDRYTELPISYLLT